MELYGFGRSARVRWGQRWDSGSLENSIDQMTSALERWRETLLIPEFALVTHSLSCYIGIAYLLKYPGRITHLYLTSPIGLHSTFSTHSPLVGYRANSFTSPSSDHTDISLPSVAFQTPPRSVIEPSHFLSSLSCQCQPVSQVLWENNFTPMDFLRWLGPMGNIFLN